MPDSVIFHPCVDILIGTSHQAHYKLIICVCPATPCIAAWSLLCNSIPFEWRQISLPKGGIGKSYTGTPVTSALCHSMNQASSVGSKIYPPNVQWLGRAMAPLQIYVANITILNSITSWPLFILELAPDQQWIMFSINFFYMYFRSHICWLLHKPIGMQFFARFETIVNNP